MSWEMVSSGGLGLVSDHRIFGKRSKGEDVKLWKIAIASYLPIVCSSNKFQPMTNAMNSPTAT